MRCIDAKLIRARKGHVCDLCLLPIEPGDRYHNMKFTDEDTIWTWKEHRACQRLTSVLFSVDDVIESGDFMTALAELDEHTVRHELADLSSTETTLGLKVWRIGVDRWK